MATYWDVYHDYDDGSVSNPVSKAGDFDDPVYFELRIDLEETKSDSLYIQAETGYYVEDVTVEPIGDPDEEDTTEDKWEVKTATGDTWEPSIGLSGDSYSKLTVYDSDSGGPTEFDIRASVSDTESVQRDQTVLVQIEGIVYPE